MVWYGVMGVIGAPKSLALLDTSFSYYMTPLIAMYPTLVVLLVATRHSVLERSIDQAIQPSFNMRFATNPGAPSYNDPLPHSHVSSHPQVDIPRVEIQSMSVESIRVIRGSSTDSDRNEAGAVNAEQ
ncbi:hypothetical protein PENSPDRAFT_651864 [Peniophora sp. CONT]|nr:hypothetical protein PENSPDRAFT_651864 [Peniophora sp. CONT]